MTLKTVCTRALEELSGFEIPSTFYDNQNLTARTCVALVTRQGRTLEMQQRWSSLLSTYTFSTVADQAAYDLPSDWRAFGNVSQWNRSSHRQMIGPSSAFEWQWLKGWIGASATIDVWFRIEGTQMILHPTPTSVQTMAFDYYSKNWITKVSDSTTATEFTHDNDTSKLDEDLLILGLKWRFLQSKGMPFEPEYREYEAMLEEATADAGGKRSIKLGLREIKWDGLPDTGYGTDSQP